MKFVCRTNLGPVRSGAIGLVLARPTRLSGVEPFFMELIGGLEEAFTGEGLSILLHVVVDHEQEIEAYRRWSASGVADAVIVLNLTEGDIRPPALAELGLPAVLVGDWTGEPAFMSVATDDGGPVRDAARRLLAMGHRRIARVTGPGNLIHTRRRTAALVEACVAAGIEPVVIEGDYTEAGGLAQTRRLLSVAEPPTAIMYDNDVMALGGLTAADLARVPVPGRLSIVAWDDSTACRLSHPPLTVMAVDVHRYGLTVGRAVLDVLDGKPATTRETPPARWVDRGSTGPATSDLTV
jgi:DNA-binding LacI/PurR family transcriptional regulator